MWKYQLTKLPEISLLWTRHLSFISAFYSPTALESRRKSPHSRPSSVQHNVNYLGPIEKNETTTDVNMLRVRKLQFYISSLQFGKTLLQIKTVLSLDAGPLKQNHLLPAAAEYKVIIFCSNCVSVTVYIFIYSFGLKEEKQITDPDTWPSNLQSPPRRVIGERETTGSGGERDAKGQKNEPAGRELIEISGDVSP